MTSALQQQADFYNDSWCTMVTALADLDGALTCYRAIAVELGITLLSKIERSR